MTESRDIATSEARSLARSPVPPLPSVLYALAPRQQRAFSISMSSGSEDSQGRDRNGRRHQQSGDDENDEPSLRGEVVDDAPSPREAVAGDASPCRE